ncbi:hypothetical protein D3878_06515 [Noviherbaspirillum sedimenti]|uniref:Pectate lyase superfamily protein domain-containing protein n=1 Tax=Noviherbaspirillum sedimenti TaxID=2320865 RepID=A0A3A3GJZ6_9BURK|nr:hypothetical protein D3878_06515 [Noviherbaspirillum sedimenti]
MVPAYSVSLAAYGGVPGASPSVLREAFSQAFSALRKNGGGILLVPAGLYDFGSYATSTYINLVKDLSNVAISAYGATFKATTTASVMPHMFYFLNFNNITIAGAGFADPGFTPWINWKGMYCVGIQSSKASRGFRMVDCHAERVLGLFGTNNNAATRQFLADVNIHGKVRYAYYGVGASFISEQVQVDLNCHNVRRAFIAYAMKNADIKVTASSTENWPGSNGLIALVCDGSDSGNVENVQVKVNASGAGIYGCYVHFYHQGPEVDGYMRDIDATVNATNVHSKQNLFLFDHESNGVQPKTARIWDRISLDGSVTGSLAGRIISNPSFSTSPGTVFVSEKLAGLTDLSKLPAYFRRKKTNELFTEIQ